MTEFDFDELDRSINEAMARRNDDTESTADFDESAEVPSEESATSSSAAQSSPATRRRGQFMDMVHPSSDMTSKTPGQSGAKAVRRRMPVIQPLNNPEEIKPEEPIRATVSSKELEDVEAIDLLTPLEPKSESHAKKDSEHEAKSEDVKPSGDQKDSAEPKEDKKESDEDTASKDEDRPLHIESTEQAENIDPATAIENMLVTDSIDKFDPVAPALDEQRDAPEFGADVAHVESEELAGFDSDSQTSMTETPHEIESDAQDSPFLPDAKPEKRPLGAAPAAVSGGNIAVTVQAADDTPGADALPAPADEIDSQDPEEQLSAGEKSLSEPEVSDDDAEALDVTITSDLDPESQQETIADHEPESPDTQTQEAETSDTTEPNTATEEYATSVQDVEAEKPVAKGPVSIPQQYVEKPSESQPTGAIYDTEQYHTPVKDKSVKQKKSRVFGWLVWIVLLLLLGVIAGAGYYFLTML